MSEVSWSKWYVHKDGVRRCHYADGRQVWQRLARAKYRHCKTPAELAQFIDRLNHRYEVDLAKAKAAYDFKHLFISADLLEEFEALLKAEIPNKNVSKSMFTYLRRHGLHWFINQSGITDPIEWKEHERTWGLALLCKLEGKQAEKLMIWDSPVHPDTIAKNVQVMNRFLKYLHKKIPKEVPAIVLEPISKAQSRLYKSEYKAKASKQASKYITDEDWKMIEKGVDPTIKGFVQLGYYYGLRQSECMAVSSDDLYEDNLEIKRQLVAFTDGKPEFGPLKNRAERHVPHWFTTPSETHKIISSIAKLMHPDTFYKRFDSEMERMGLKYSLHDLRRTFITRCFRASKVPRDIQLAAGHSDLDTTLRYAQDDRALGRKRFIPSA